ncbi:MAG: cytochrome P460 family protein [Bacteroidetes bacterium]|nr:cytochrome P460 family protein [Bacteroidota bacterium]
MKKTIITLIIASAYVVFVFASGFTVIQKDGIQTTQKDIDMSTTPVKLSVTGTPLGDVSIAHDGRDISADSSFRDSYTNMSLPKGEIKPGTIFTKRAYLRKSDGSKGNLEMIFAMIKQKKGYYPAGGDWEYISISPEKNTNYKVHPNGMLPQKVDNDARGKITFCGDCHKKASGSDFVFTN